MSDHLALIPFGKKQHATRGVRTKLLRWRHHAVVRRPTRRGPTHNAIDTSYIKSIYGRDLTGRNSTDRGRRATKLSALVDSDGVVHSLAFFPGNTSDYSTVEATLAGRLTDTPRGTALYADEGYDSRLGPVLDRVVPAVRERRRVRARGEAVAQLAAEQLDAEGVSLQPQQVGEHVVADEDEAFLYIEYLEAPRGQQPLGAAAQPIRQFAYLFRDEPLQLLRFLASAPDKGTTHATRLAAALAEELESITWRPLLAALSVHVELLKANGQTDVPPAAKLHARFSKSMVKAAKKRQGGRSKLEETIEYSKACLVQTIETLNLPQGGGAHVPLKHWVQRAVDEVQVAVIRRDRFVHGMVQEWRVSILFQAPSSRRDARKCLIGPFLCPTHLPRQRWNESH
ncbi:hypothetical protein AB1Y20_008542 [Prymnesium parvum]|uniref:Transposase IS4-like domain-containing protein n=1 Tax=Prymnesium parvum TaxID=97485 RepID=A0AB34IQK8_PRYPA